MKSRVLEGEGSRRRRFDYRDTTEVLRGFFGRGPGPAGALLVGALSKFMRPLEQGTYAGRRLTGEPHRSAWVIASPLTVFVLPEAGRLRILFLRARLRSTGPVNVIVNPPLGAHRRDRGRRGRDGAGAGGTWERLEKLGIPAPEHRTPVEGARDQQLEALVAIQKESQVSITLVPVARAFHQLTPDAPATTIAARFYKFSPIHLLRRATNWARTVRTGRVKNCRPLVLSRWLDQRPESRGDVCALASELRIELMGQIESERRACTGPPLPPPWEVRRRVLADPLLSVYMQEYAIREGTTREAVIEEARGHIKEIQSEYRVGVARYFCKVVDYLFDRFLDGVDVDREGMRFLAECDNRSRVVMVCDHKSYVDSLLIGYSMFRSGMVPPQQAAGQNMDFWPMGWLLRHSGAFYIRRTFMGETLYKEVFRAYVRYLLAENYTSVVYIEGTRSRDGKLSRPKIGYMGILADALRMGVCPEITLVPVYMSFDRIPEEASLVKEMAGSRKVSETMGLFASIIASVKTRLGKAYVRFGTPMSFRALLEDYGLRGAAEVVCGEINRLTVVTARSLAGGALLARGDGWVSEEEFERFAGDLLSYCERHRLPMAVDADAEGVRRAAGQYVDDGYVSRRERDGVAGFAVEGYGRRFLEYNKNIQLPHFLDPAIAALAGRSRQYSAGAEDGDGAGGRAEFLQRVFSEEFVFTPGKRDESWKLDYRSYSRVLCSLLESYLEGYLVACRAIGSLEAGEPVSAREVVTLCFAEGEKMLDDGSIRREESLSQVAFKNAVKNYRKMGLLAEAERKSGDGTDEKVLLPGPLFNERRSIEDGLLSFLEI